MVQLVLSALNNFVNNSVKKKVIQGGRISWCSTIYGKELVLYAGVSKNNWCQEGVQ